MGFDSSVLMADRADGVAGFFWKKPRIDLWDLSVLMELDVFSDADFGVDISLASDPRAIVKGKVQEDDLNRICNERVP